jgi:predicted metal-dependent hydrolase
MGHNVSRPEPAWEVLLTVPEIDALLYPHEPNEARSSACRKLEEAHRLLSPLRSAYDRLDEIKEALRDA